MLDTLESAHAGRQPACIYARGNTCPALLRLAYSAAPSCCELVCWSLHVLNIRMAILQHDIMAAQQAAPLYDKVVVCQGVDRVSKALAVDVEVQPPVAVQNESSAHVCPLDFVVIRLEHSHCPGIVLF